MPVAEPSREPNRIAVYPGGVLGGNRKPDEEEPQPATTTTVKTISARRTSLTLSITR
jgi:hypothetical protein